METETTTMRLHEYLRGDLKAMEELLERMESQVRLARAHLSMMTLVADDLQVIEEGDVETPAPDEEARCACGHLWALHTRTTNGADACRHFGCGCRDVVQEARS